MMELWYSVGRVSVYLCTIDTVRTWPILEPQYHYNSYSIGTSVLSEMTWQDVFRPCSRGVCGFATI